MRYPDDTPDWVARVFNELAEEVDRLVSKSTTSDMAMKAAGAYLMLSKLKVEIDLEVARQHREQKQRIDELHARQPADA